MRHAAGNGIAGSRAFAWRAGHFPPIATSRQSLYRPLPGAGVALRLYNVRTRAKEEFRPRDPKRVSVYVCGLTVYDHAHIGHARTAVSFEVARRWLEHRYPGKVTFVQNVTDVDDK